jgi:CDP-glycerol glycerophosphotransferase (TagB/SpsB family)
MDRLFYLEVHMIELGVIIKDYNSKEQLEKNIKLIKEEKICKSIYVVDNDNTLDNIIYYKVKEKYILIIDCNDSIRFNKIKEHMKKDYEYDYLFFPKYIKNGRNITLPFDYKQKPYTKSEFIITRDKSPLFGLLNHGISGIIKLDIIKKNNIKFDQNIFLYDNEAYAKKILHYSNCIKYINDEIFYINKKSSKIFNSHSYDKILEMNNMYFQIKDILNKEELNNFQYIVIKNIIYFIDYTYNKMDRKIKIELLTKITKLFTDINDLVISRFNLEKRDLIYLLREENYECAISYIELLLSRNYYRDMEMKLKKEIKKYPDISNMKLFKILRPVMRFYDLINILYEKIQYINILIVSKLLKICFYRKKVILIGERTDQAEDNAYHLFKYIRTNYKQEKIYYIINKDSEQYKNVEEYGNIINYNSFKHKVYMLIADVFVSAYHFKSFSYPKNFNKYEKYINAKEIFLQHGVYIHDVSEWTFVEKNPYNLLVTSSPLEKKYVVNEMGYSYDVVKDIGLCRFDNLYNNDVKNEILLMPTWRSFLKNENLKSFKYTEYYKKYISLLKNDKLRRILEKNNVVLNFYIHSEMQNFIELFEIEFDNIKILKKSDISVQQLLKENALLITDYSSVSADFLYMNKPVIMYQFDPDRYQYKPSKYISYKEVGIVIDNEDKVVKEIERIIKNKFKIDYKYTKNRKRIFKFMDQNNCERNYRAILEVLDESK